MHHELYVLSPAQILSKMKTAEPITGPKVQEPNTQSNGLLLTTLALKLERSILI